MMMHLETRKKRAFEKLRQAQVSLTSFEQSKQQNELKQASDRLDEALAIDPNYLRAIYYRGLVRDMMGKSHEAVEDFREVIEHSPPFLPEARYNLGVATFHHYGDDKLNEAVEEFQEVVKSTHDPALKLRARAFIAHAYAVMMIPRLAEKTEDCRKINEFLASNSARQHVEKYHKLSLTQSKELASEIEAPTLDSATRDEIKWRLCNTRAVQRMFYTDYFERDRVKKLKEAEEALQEADNLNPLNWSIYCNLGSTYMRLGHWIKKEKQGVNSEQQAEEYFGKAIQRLDKVIAELLPNYDFALYEKGRVYRLWGNFPEAKLWLKQASQKKENERAVSNRTLKCELERVELESTDYPFLRSDHPKAS